MSRISTIGYSLMIIAYTIVLVDKLGMIFGLVASISTIILILLTLKYIVPIVDKDKEYHDELVDLALKKVNSSYLENKKLALDQMIQFYEDDKAFYGLCDILRNEKDKSMKDLILKYICIINKKRKNKWETIQSDLSKYS